MTDFQDQVALVTGAARGIGRHLAEDLASRGAQLVLCDLIPDQLEQVAERIRTAGAEAVSIPMDVSQADQVKAGVKRALGTFGKITILINNAGITKDGLFLRMKEDAWRAVMDINLDGVYRVTRQILPSMVRNRYGRIVNIASVVALMGNPGQANYVASKAGLIGLTKALALEVASRGITVNAVAPGFISTQMTAGLSEEVQAKMVGSIPLGRIGTVEDVASGIRFLASKEAGYVTGHVLNINGGMYM
jgi:3-oxoacyl-[acyl-carrier protein] reductase